MPLPHTLMRIALNKPSPTPLYTLHEKLQAKMVDFAGYLMPQQYPQGIIAEHLHCRSQAGLFDISHMGQCLIAGSNAAEQLQALTPSAIAHLQPGQQRYTILSNEQGGIIDDLIISCLEPERFLVIVNAACKDKDFAYLHAQFGEAFHELSDRALIALQGPKAHDIMHSLSPPTAQLKFMQLRQTQLNGVDCIIGRCGYTGEDGFEISLPTEHAIKVAETLLNFDAVQAIGLGARNTLRLEAGLSLYGHDLSENISPIEAGLAWLVSSTNLQYPGKGIIQKQRQHGAERKRVGLIVDGKIPVRDETDIMNADDKIVGKITSGGYSPTLQKHIALALIDSRCQPQTLYAQVRKHRIAMQISPLPFTPHRYYRG